MRFILATAALLALAACTEAGAPMMGGATPAQPLPAQVLAALPTAVVYILLGRFFIRGLLAGSMKG